MKKKKSRNTKPQSRGVGRPTVITPEVTAKLLSAFSVGANIGEACRFAGISEDTFSRALKSSPEFCGKIEASRDQLILKAKSEIAKLIHAGDVHAAMWYLERKCRAEFSKHYEVDHTSAGERIGFNMVVKK